MRSRLVLLPMGFLVVLAVMAPSLMVVAQDSAKSRTVTFNRDVLPILQKNCQTCHRPGEIAPMSFLSYQDVRPWAKSIKQKVIDRQMPPWFAEPQYGHFRNDRRLSDAD